MLDLIREVLQCAQRNALLRRILDISVTNSRVRNNYLGVAFCTKSSTLEQRLLEPNALPIDILPSFYVINGIYYEGEVCPEIIVENGLILLTHSEFQCLEFDRVVDTFAH